MVPCRVGAGQTKYRNLRGFVEVGEDLASREKAPETGDKVAAGPGFEPGLSDSESLVLPLHHPARKATRRILTSISPSVEFTDNLLPASKNLYGSVGRSGTITAASKSAG
jgi:hypothetical protein